MFIGKQVGRYNNVTAGIWFIWNSYVFDVLKYEAIRCHRRCHSVTRQIEVDSLPRLKSSPLWGVAETTGSGRCARLSLSVGVVWVYTHTRAKKLGYSGMGMGAKEYVGTHSHGS